MTRACASATLLRAVGALIIAVALRTACFGVGAARAQSPVAEVETSDGTAVMTVFDNGVIEAPAREGGFLLPDGTLLDQSSDLGSFGLPFSGTTSTSSDLLSLTQTGSGRAGRFAIDNTESFIEALLASSNGSGTAVKGLQTGTGRAGLFQVLNESSDADALSATTNGTGRAGDFSITNTESFAPVLFAETVGRGRAGLFRIANASSGAEALHVETNGVAHAGVFEIDNTSNDSSAVQGITNGIGPAVEGRQGGTRGPAGVFDIFNSNNAAAALRAETSGDGPALRAETFGNGPALYVEKNGRQNHAGVFEIVNSGNDSSAVQGITKGTGPAVEGRQGGTRGSAGVFDIVNSDNDAAALRAETSGNGFAAEMTAFKSATVRDNPDGNIVLMRNSSNLSGPDVLGLQAGPSTPTSGVNYVSFYDGSGTSVGAIEGNGSGGVLYKTSGADYAEALPVAEGAADPEPADLVGVHGGAVGLETNGADRLMVVTGQAAVLGNAPLGKADSEGAAEPAGRVPVAFVGQVPVKVRGRAAPGDWIIASGRGDGTAQAVAPAAYRPARHGPIAGQAWSNKTTSGIGKVTVAVGLGHSTSLADRLREQQNQIDSLRGRLRAVEEIREKQERIAEQIALLKARPSGPARAGRSSVLLLAVVLGLGAFGGGVLWRRRP